MIAITSPAPNATFKDNEVITVTGTDGPLAGATDTPRGGTPVDLGVSDPNVNWSFTCGPLGVGEHTITVIGRDGSTASVTIIIIPH